MSLPPSHNLGSLLFFCLYATAVATAPARPTLLQHLTYVPSVCKTSAQAFWTFPPPFVHGVGLGMRWARVYVNAAGYMCGRPKDGRMTSEGEYDENNKRGVRARSPRFSTSCGRPQARQRRFDIRDVMSSRCIDCAGDFCELATRYALSNVAWDTACDRLDILLAYMSYFFSSWTVGSRHGTTPTPTESVDVPTRFGASRTAPVQSPLAVLCPIPTPLGPTSSPPQRILSGSAFRLFRGTKEAIIGKTMTVSFAFLEDSDADDEDLFSFGVGWFTVHLRSSSLIEFGANDDTDFRLLDEIRDLLQIWAEWNTFEGLVNYHSVVDTLLGILNDRRWDLHGGSHTISTEIFNKLSRDVDILHEQFISILLNSFGDFLACHGELAQKLLNLLQDLLDLFPESTTRPLMSKALLYLWLEKRPMAAGAFGDICKGLVRDQTVCVKIMRLFIDTDWQTAEQQLGREAIIWRQLSHPNLLPFFGLYSLDERLCLVSPWMSSGNICEFLKSAAPYTDRVSLMLDVALGLEYLHRNGVVHGNLKGSNVLITPSRRACLADFGLSSIRTISDATTVRVTNSDEITRGGSVRYQAPELNSMSTDTTPDHFGSDVYAFACTCYEILTGKAPFYEMRNDIAVIMSVLSGKRPSLPNTILPNDSLWLLLQDCWAQNSANRPSLTQVIQRLLSPAIGARETRSSTDWDDTFSAKFRRSLQDFPLLPSVIEIKRRLFCDENPTQMVQTTILDSIEKESINRLNIPRNFIDYAFSLPLRLSHRQVDDIRSLLELWVGFDELECIAGFHSVDSAPSGKAIAERISSELSQDVEVLFGQLAHILRNPEVYKELLACRGDLAQQLLDILQDLLDLFPESEERPSVSKALLRLSRASELHPVCFTLNELQTVGESQVAGGTFGDIWKGLVRHQIVSVKIMRLFNEIDVKHAVQNFGREAVIWRQLSHPNVLPFFGLYYLDHRLCLISPWMPSGNIMGFLKTAPADTDRPSLMLDVALGLEYLHRNSVVHGDLKGPNVLVTPSGRACLTDFGLSSIVDAMTVRFTHSTASVQGEPFWI
ncbi:kinase-like domain-containing protein [Mycena leptocephala]|nr:kinase-like domain-containing protein [Mycena leptocephala]